MGLIRSIALNYIKSQAGLNIPGSTIIEGLARQGLTYRRTDMLTDIRQAEGRVKYQTQIEKLTGNQLVPNAWMTNEKLGAPYDYRVQFKVTYYDPATDQLISTYRHMFTDTYVNKAGWMSDFPTYAEQTGSTPDWEFYSIEVSGVAKNTY